MKKMKITFYTVVKNFFSHHYRITVRGGGRIVRFFPTFPELLLLLSSLTIFLNRIVFYGLVVKNRKKGSIESYRDGISISSPVLPSTPFFSRWKKKIVFTYLPWSSRTTSFPTFTILTDCRPSFFIKTSVSYAYRVMSPLFLKGHCVLFSDPTRLPLPATLIFYKNLWSILV